MKKPCAQTNVWKKPCCFPGSIAATAKKKRTTTTRKKKKHRRRTLHGTPGRYRGDFHRSGLVLQPLVYLFLLLGEDIADAHVDCSARVRKNKLVLRVGNF